MNYIDYELFIFYIYFRPSRLLSSQDTNYPTAAPLELKLIIVKKFYLLFFNIFAKNYALNFQSFRA